MKKMPIPYGSLSTREIAMTRFAYSTGLALLLLCGLALADNKDADNKDAKHKDANHKDAAKATAITKGQVVIEINGQPQIIELNGAPDTLKKQLRIVTDKLSKNAGKSKTDGKSTDGKSTDGKSKNGGSSTDSSSSGSFSFHTIIVGPDGVVTEEKVEKVLDGKALNDMKMLKNLPDAVRKQVEAAMKKAGVQKQIQLQLDAGKNPDAKLQKLGIFAKKMDLDTFLKESGKELPEAVRKQLMDAMEGMDAKGIAHGNFQGRAIVIGPDGKKQEFQFGKDQGNAPAKKIQPARKLKPGQKISAPVGDKAKADSDENIAKVLKQILSRLDKIEGELEARKNGEKDLRK